MKEEEGRVGESYQATLQAQQFVLWTEETSSG
jgi:hypothetical protein